MYIHFHCTCNIRFNCVKIEQSSENRSKTLCRSLQCSSRLGNTATEHNKQIKTLPENSLRIQEKVLKTGRNVYRGFNIFKGTKSTQTSEKRNKSLCLLRTAEHHGTYRPLSVCMSCKPKSTILHTITDGQMSGKGPPKLNLVDNRRLF